MSSFIPGGAEDPGLSHSTGLGPDLGVQGLQPLINGQVCLSETQAAGISAQPPSPLPAAPVSTLGASQNITVSNEHHLHKGTQEGWFPKSNYMEHFFFYKEMQALTWKSLQEPAHHSERSVSSGARQTWVWAHVLSTHLIPDQLLHFSEPQFTYWQNRDNNMSLGRLF